MKVAVKTNRRELIGVGGIWLFLLTISLIAWLLLKLNANRIINYIEYVETGRFGRALVLYDEAQKNARQVMEKSFELNEKSAAKITLPQSDPAVKRALTSYQRAVRLDPRTPFSPDREIHYDFQATIHEATGNKLLQRLAHAEAFLCRGDISNARHYVALAAEVESSSTQMLLVRANVENGDGKSSAALAALDQIFANGKVPTNARVLKAQILHNSGQVEQAIGELQQAVKADTGNSDIYKQLALYQQTAGHLEDAVNTYRSGLDFGGSTDGNYMHMYGTVLYDRGETAESITALELAAELEPGSGSIQYDLARSYQKNGQVALAGRALQLAIKLDPSLAKEVF